MSFVFAAYKPVIFSLAILSVGSLFVAIGVIASGEKLRKKENVKRILKFTPICAFLMLVSYYFMTQHLLWVRLRSLPIEQVTSACITRDGQKFDITSVQARAIHDAIAKSNRVSAHHSHPVYRLTLEFSGENIDQYIYTLGPDSVNTNEFWIDDQIAGPSPDMGQFTSETLHSILDAAIENQ